MIELEFREKILNKFLEAMDNMGKGRNTLNWPILMATKDYYVARFKYTGDDFLERNGELLETQLFFYGAVAVSQIGDNRAITPFVRIKTDYNYNILEGLLNYSTRNIYNNHLPETSNKKVVEGKDGVFVKSDVWSVPRWVWYMNYLYELDLSLSSLSINRIRSVKKDIFKTDKNVSPQMIAELQRIRDTNSWATIVKSKDLSFFDKLQWDYVNEQSDLWDDRTNLLCEYFYLMGIKYNIGEKSERNTPAEVNLNISRFELLEQKDLKFREDFIKRYNILFNTNASVELVETQAEMSVTRENDQINGGVTNDRE